MAVGIVAHDRMKAAMVRWMRKHRKKFLGLRIYATGQTGGRVARACPELNITRLASGPLGGDQQLGALIAEAKLDALFFFIDPLSPHPHDVDVKALLRLAVVYDIPAACNAATASLMVIALTNSAGRIEFPQKIARRLQKRRARRRSSTSKPPATTTSRV